MEEPRTYYDWSVFVTLDSILHHPRIPKLIIRVENLASDDEYPVLLRHLETHGLVLRVYIDLIMM